MCGYTAGVAVELTSGAPTRTVTMPVTGMGVNNKCTWVTYSAIAAPTFLFGESATPDGLTGTNWEIHAMEYTASSTTSFVAANGSLVPGAGSGLIKEAEALDAGNMTPLFTMPAEQFATLRTWYGEGAVAVDTMTQQSANWLSPGQAAMTNTADQSLKLLAVRSQLYGNVANVPVSNYVAQPTSTASLGNFNYGKYNNTNVFDLRQIRYFPAKVAQTQYASGVAALAKYNSALSAYGTAKTTWDNYVAILEKNSSQDAFAALFSPPKAPTVPPLPNKPWVPAAYTGYTWANPQQVAGFTGNAVPVKNVANPAATQVWTNRSAAETLGGWGTFTASIFTFRNGWGKSFGTIGYDGNTASIADVWKSSW